MKILRSSKEIELTDEEFLNRVDGYEDLIIDLGTGQGAFVYFNALSNQNNFYIGLDSSRDSMKRYAVKQYKSKIENLIYVVMNAQKIDSILFGKFKEVYVNLPWGSLLQGIFKEELGIIENLSKLLCEDGLFHICFSYDTKLEKNEIEKRDLPGLGEDYFENVFKPLYGKYSLNVDFIELISKDEIPFESKWMKVLGESNRRKFYIIDGHKKGVQ